MDRMFMKITMLSVALLAACMPHAFATSVVTAEGSCGNLNRDINFEDSEVGPYTLADLQMDMDGYRYFKRLEYASIVEIGGVKYLDDKLHAGCVGTVADKGCGLMGALPLYGIGDSATLEFTVRFGDGFDFRRGGKLMGLCSGKCKSGCHSTADTGFSARMMWGPEGSLYLYTYTYSGTSKTCGMDTKPSTPVSMVPGNDYRIRMTVKMNAPDAEDGMVSLYVDGSHIVSTAIGLKMRTSAEQVIDSMVFHTFFGGSGSTWAAAKDEHIFFKNIKIWDGDCGGDDGALEFAETEKWVAETGGGPADAQKLRLETSIYGSWHGRFCLWYEVFNDGDEDCERFVLETNVNPSVGVMASHKNLKVLESDDSSGFYMFTRDVEKHAKLKPGKMRNGNVCLADSEDRNIMQSATRIESAYSFTAYCSPS